MVATSSLTVSLLWVLGHEGWQRAALPAPTLPAFISPAFTAGKNQLPTLLQYSRKTLSSGNLQFVHSVAACAI